MILSKEYLSRNYIKLIVPIVIFLGMGYFNYVVNYSLGYKLIYKNHSHASGIILWILMGLLQLSLYIYWILIFIIGPGRSPIFPPLNIYNEENNENLISLPDLFFCDKQGFPYYCSNSNSIKLERSFYSKDIGYNVLKFDHYCIWIGHPIGQNNYLFFIKFTIYYLLIFIISLIYLAIYTKDSINQGEIDHNFIVLYIFCGFWVLMIGGLLGVHLRYICLNLTTLDDITRNQRKRYSRWLESQQNPKKSSMLNDKVEPRRELGIRYVNIKHENNSRVVITYYIDNINPFNMGIRNNWINLVFNGNRNHGLDNLYYTNIRFIYSILYLLIPFIDIPICFKNRHPFKEDIELGDIVDSNKLLEIYNTYSSKVNDEFYEMIKLKISNGDFTTPVYLQHQK